MAVKGGYLGRNPGDEGSNIVARQNYSPTGITTDFTFAAGYTPGNVDVYLNGIRLVYPTDYSAGNGSTVGLTSAAASGDSLEIVAYKAFNLGSITEATGNFDVTGDQTVTGNLTVSGDITGSGTSITANNIYVGTATTIDSNGIAVTGVITATSFQGLHLGDGTSLTGVGNTTDINTNNIKISGISTLGTASADSLTVSGNISVGGTLTYADVTNIDSLGIVTARTGLKVLAGGANVVGVVTATSFEGTGSLVTGVGIASTAHYTGSWDVTADGSNNYLLVGTGITAAQMDPTLTLIRGGRYLFKNNTSGSSHPFRIQQAYGTTSGTAWDRGVTNNGGNGGTDIIFEVPHNAPQALYYQCTAHANMSGKLNIAGYSGSDIDINTTGVVTATSFSGGLSGNVTGVGTITGGTIVATAGTITTLEATSVSIGNSVTGITTFSGGVSFKSSLREAVKITAGKLSANTNIDLANGMIHYFTTQETTTCTPNIRYDASTSLNNVLEIGQQVAVTVVTTAAAGGYSAQWTVDGAAVTESWIGGSAPSAGGSSGVDVYSLNIIKTANATFTVIGNLSKTS